MKELLNCIMLIDDHFPTNYYHKVIIKKANCCKKIIEKTSAAEAINYLKTPYTTESPQPNIIFLDINMPGMTGWDFLEEYKTLTPEQKAEKIIIMLSTSADPRDFERAKKNPDISEYRSKPLTIETLLEIIKTYWPHKFD